MTTNSEYLDFLGGKGEPEILVKNKHNNNTYLAGISLAGNNIELYSIEDNSGESDLIISIKDFDTNYEFI